MNNTFAQDVKEGLSAQSKYLSSMYFYDDNGSRIFQEIMRMPEYYLTDSEFEILSLQAQQITDAVGFDKPFNIIELGPGDGFKTFKLLEYLVNKNIEFHYVPIDISKEAIDILSEKLLERLPNLSIQAKVGDYFEVLKDIKKDDTPSLLLFLGSNIGNYLEDKVDNLLTLFHQNMNKGDKLLIGVDLKKNPLIIQKAYLDDGGITKKFNLNLLLRMNRELGADFKIDDFDFYSNYNPETGEVKSYLVSLRNQKVHIKSLNQTFEFRYDELIWTELSKKYSLEQIRELAESNGFTIQQNFLDCKHYFVDSLWEK